MKRGKPSYCIRIRQEHASFFHQVLHRALVGAAGAVEAAAVIEAMRHSYAPKTAGTTELSEDIEADVIYGQGVIWKSVMPFQIHLALVGIIQSSLSNVGRPK